MRPNNSFKPTRCRGIGHVLYATLAHVRRPVTGRLNSSVRPMRNIAAILLMTIAAAGCQPHAETAASVQVNDREGREYIAELSDMIQRADRIVVTEHSFKYDAYDTNSGKSLIPKDVIYGTHQLSSQQKDLFVYTIKNLDPKTQDTFPGCIFVPHHTVMFYAGGKLESTMDICFECGQVKWDATDTTPPWSLYSGLATFIKGVGFQPERDWAALAQQHAQ